MPAIVCSNHPIWPEASCPRLCVCGMCSPLCRAHLIPLSLVRATCSDTDGSFILIMNLRCSRRLTRYVTPKTAKPSTSILQCR